MSPIKITTDNAAAIEAALKAVNGKALQHAYAVAYEIEGLAEDAEKQLESLGLPKSGRVGASWTQTSGGKVSNSYAKKCHSRTATAVRLERRSTGWFLIEAKKVEVGQSGGGAGLLTLTQAQADDATRRFRARFAVKAA